MTKSALLALTASLALVPALAAAQPAPAPAPQPAARGPSMALALEAVQAAVAECKSTAGRNVAAAVVDSAGITRALAAGDGAVKRAVESSAQKAQTAVLLKQPTIDAVAKAKADPALAASYAAQPGLLMQPGGRPLLVGGEVIGGIGVGGAAPQQDDACAAAAIAKIADRLR